MKHKPLAILFGLLLAFTAVAKADELQDRQKIIEQVKHAYGKENFSQLESLTGQFRRDKSRTSSGLWKLTLAYSGIHSAIAGGRGLSDEWFKYMEEKTAIWIAAYPKSPAARLAHADALISHGWFFRGGGYSNTVTESGWNHFNKYLALAYDHLEKSKAVASNDPRWYDLMLDVARAQGWDKARFDKLLNEAISKEPGYYEIYFSALDYLLPKWHGDINQVEQFAQEAVRKTRQQEGLGMYARIYWYASQSQFGNELFNESQVFWPMMRRGFDDVVSRYPDAWNMNNYARFACLAGDGQKTRELMPKIYNGWLVQAWGSPELFAQCLNWSQDHSPPPTEERRSRGEAT